MGATISRNATPVRARRDLANLTDCQLFSVFRNRDAGRFHEDMRILPAGCVVAIGVLSGCAEDTGNSVESRQHAVVGVTWPTSASVWRPMYQNGTMVGDVFGDGNNNGREVVGDATRPAIQ